ncbi:MAG: glycosyltransferase family 2 protein, partial [Candidatus Latescibacterota bacterium]
MEGKANGASGRSDILQTSQRSLAIVIPMYNEVDAVPLLAYKLKAVLKIVDGLIDTHLVLVDDGSTDMTLREMRAHFVGDERVRFVRHWKNQGFGVALRSGVDAALELGVDLVITIDADTNYDHFYIPYFVDQFSPECDIMTASPWHPAGEAANFPWRRLILSKGLSYLYRRVLARYGQPLYCYSACFRIARADVYRRIHWTGRDFLATSEIMARCIANGLRVR